MADQTPAMTTDSSSTLDTTTQGNLNRAFASLSDTQSSSSAGFISALNSIASAITASIIGGITGATANRILTSKGATGRALQPSVVSIDSSGNITGATSITDASITAFAVVCGGTTTANPLQPVASVGTAKQLLTSNGAGALPTFQSLVDGIGGMILTPTNQAYRIWLNSPFACTITSTTTRCTSGTCTLTFNVNGGGIGGSANAVSTTQQAQTHSAAVAAGNFIEMTVSANAACTNLSFQIAIARP